MQIMHMYTYVPRFYSAERTAKSRTGTGRVGRQELSRSCGFSNNLICGVTRFNRLCGWWVVGVFTETV